MFAHVCVRAGSRVSTVLLSLCLFIVVPVFSVLLVFRFLVFVILFAFVSFFVCLFVCVCVCVCVCVSMFECCFYRISAGHHPCVRACYFCAP